MDNIEQIRSRINIVDLIREYIELKKAGANWKAPCPFHSEKTPSFIVSEDKQIWHCFGCGEGGDIFGFIMRMEGMDFPEALRHLAKRAGVVLKRQDPKFTSQKSKTGDILEAAAFFYSSELYRSEVALKYLKERGLSDETIKEFRLGFSPQSWDALLKNLKARGFRENDIAFAGLLNQKNIGSGFYDRFRGRVMFPIFNHMGGIVGFTARVLPQFDDGKMGKYINTPETIAYKKSQILYGLNFAKQEIKKLGKGVLVEGNMDVIALHQAGFKNVVATSGTALTSEQVRLIKRYTDDIIVSFDADSAGVEAALRGIDIALSGGLNVKVLEMPKNKEGAPLAKDPDELVKKYPEKWIKATSSPKHIIGFYIDANLPKFNLEDTTEASRFCKIILEQISKLKNSVERGLWIKRLSEITGAREDDLRSQMFKKKSDKIYQPKEQKQKQTKIDLSELKYVALLVSDFENYKEFLEIVNPEMLKAEGVREFYKHVNLYYNEKQSFDAEDFRLWFEKLGKNPLILDKLLMLKDKEYGEFTEDLLGEMRGLSLYLKNNYLREQRQILGIQMQEAERAGDKEKMGEIMERFKIL